MSLTRLNDKDLLQQTKQLVHKERRLLTQVLHHLKEVERRKLFSDLGYQSLFEYAVKELKYSEGQAGRRIQAMRLIRELPQLEEKIQKGKLSLSNLSQAQSYFREANKSAPQQRLTTTQKLGVLERLENRSAREGQKILLQMNPEPSLPKERQRKVTESHTEVRFVMTDNMKNKLEELRSLLGHKGATMSLAELIDFMTDIAVENVQAKKFGKKRSQATPTSELESQKGRTQVSANRRYISKSLHHQIWKRDKGRCCQCGSQRNLNIDHIMPVALGGHSEARNLRLLCFQCNQRQAMKVFGVDYIRQRQAPKQTALGDKERQIQLTEHQRCLENARVEASFF